MKQLMENWRRYVALNEVDSRIQKQLYNLLELGNIGIAVTNDGFARAVRYVLITDPDAEHPQFHDMAFPGDITWEHVEDEDDYYDNPDKYRLYGQVEFYKADPKHDGNCYDGWVIMATGAEQGWGPLLYEVALEWASQKGGGLTADRGIVSPKAMAVWDKYAKRSDIDVRQMDISHELDGAKLGRHQAVQKNYPQITPDQPADDCDQGKAVAMAGPDWSDTSVSKMYYKETPEIMQALKSAGRLIIVSD